jgi:hypothetical protein
MIKKLLTAAAVVGCVNAYAMTITATVTDTGMVVVDASGAIQAGDAAKLSAAYDREKVRPGARTAESPMKRLLRVNTPGGDLQEAMRIGRWVRENKMQVVVTPQAQCFSSCVYILAAGVVKHPFGDVGIHRPYLVTAPAGSIDATMKKALSDSQAYFTEMNIPAQLADAMFSTPPEHIELLGDAKLTFYRLNQDDFGYSEERDIQNAATYGISRQEYAVRRVKFEKDVKQCDRIKDTRGYVECANRVLEANGLRPK